MRNIVYICRIPDLPFFTEKNTSFFKTEFIRTDDFSDVMEKDAGLIVCQSDAGSPGLEKIISKKYPVLFFSGKKTKARSESETDNGNSVENSLISRLNIYFRFNENYDMEVLDQVFENYGNILLQKKKENYYRTELEKKEKLNREFLKVGIALSAERDNSKLLNYIMAKTREVTKSDAGSLYLLDPDKKTGTVSMIFKIAHNDSNPTDFSEFRMPVKKESIAGYVAITGEVIKLDDAYSIPSSAEYSFNKSYDESTGYRTKSMLTVPMKNHKDKIIGVIQLINKKKEKNIVLSGHDIVEEAVLPFEKADEEIVLSLSSLAAVSLDNNQLYHEIEELFECLVRASAKAIEQRDPATSGHSSRVAQYTVMLAEAVSADNEFFSDVRFTDDQLKGLRYACLLHDFGKVGVRENVLVKAKKLYPGMLEQILLRFDNIKNNIKINYLEAKLALDSSDPEYKAKLEDLIVREGIETAKIGKYRETVISANEPAVLDSEPGEILAEIRKEKSHDFLSETEYEFLSVKRGSLTRKEREEIMSHARHTYDFLKNIPWPENMAWIPEIAKGHHEALDGSGYPDGIKGDAIPLESRLMAVSDIFDALTASDRPYKRSVPAEKAAAILQEEASAGRLDSEVVRLFIKSGIYKAVSQYPGQ